MDPAMALYQAQLYRHYWDQQQQQHAANRSALDSSQWSPYMAPVFGLPPSSLPGQAQQSDTPIRSSNMELYGRLFNSMPPSSSNGLLRPTSSPTISTAATSVAPPFFNPFWNFFGSPTESLMPSSTVPNYEGGSTNWSSPTIPYNNYSMKGGLEIKVEQPSPPISRSKNYKSSLVTSSKKKDQVGSKRASLQQKEHCLQSPTSSSASRSNPSPEKRSGSRNSFVCRLPCDSSSEMVPPTPPSSSVNLEDQHDESDSEKDCGALVICGLEELEDGSKVKEGPQVVSSISPVMLKRSSSAACQTWQDEEDLLIGLVDRVSIPMDTLEKTRTCSATYLQPRWCMRAAQLDLAKVDPLALNNSAFNGLCTEDTLSVSTCDTAVVTSTNRSEGGSSTMCADTVQQSRFTQTRPLKRVLCDGCNKKCRLRKKEFTSLTSSVAGLSGSPVEVKSSAPHLHLSDALRHFTQSRANDLNPVTLSITNFCTTFVHNFLKYENHLDLSIFETNVMEGLTKCLESLQKKLASNDEKVVTSKNVLSQTGQTLLQHVANTRRCLSNYGDLASSTSRVSFPSELSDEDKNMEKWMDQQSKLMSSTPSLKLKSEKSFLSESNQSSGYISAYQLNDSLETEDIIKAANPSDSHLNFTASKPLCININTSSEVAVELQPSPVDRKKKHAFHLDSTDSGKRLSTDELLRNAGRKRSRLHDLTCSSENFEFSRTPPPSLEREAPLLEMRPFTPELRSCVLNRIDLYDGQRILITVDGNWFAATLQVDTRRGGADVGYFSAALDGGRQLSLSSDQLLNSAILEVQPGNKRQLPIGSRIAAYFTSEATNPLFAGTVSQASEQILTEKEVFVKLDDGDERIVNIDWVRMLPVDTPVMSADARGDIFLSVPRRPRQKVGSVGFALQRQQSHLEVGRSSSSMAISERRRKSTCLSSPTIISGAVVKDLVVTAPAVGSAPMRQFQWGDCGVPKGRKVKHKILLCNGQSLSIGDVAQFLSGEGERPYLGRIDDLMEENGHMWVRATWYYQPSEMGVAGQPFLHTPAAIFCSTHTDTNEIQTVLKPVRVLSLLEYRRSAQDLSSEDVFFEAGVYDAVRCRVKTVFDDVKVEDGSITFASSTKSLTRT